MVWCGIPARTETILTLLFMFAIVMLVKDLVVVCLGGKNCPVLGNISQKSKQN